MGINRLSGLDASFLHLERDGAHMHVASTMVLAGPCPSYEEFRELIRSRLHLVPRFRQKLRDVPFQQGRPIWVDDPHFNLDYHVRHTALPAPGDDPQLQTFAARVFSQGLDRSKPLWELWLVEDLSENRFAVVGKSHHCLVDGISGVDITTVLFDLERNPEPAPPPPAWVPKPEPSDLDVLASALAERAVQPAEGIRAARALLRTPKRVLVGALDAIASAGAVAGSGLSAPSTPLNVEIGGQRRFACVSADLGDLRRFKDVYGGTVNDVVLTVVSGALGRYLRSIGESTESLTLQAMVPISVRGQSGRGELGNQISAVTVTLPIFSEDPIDRLRLIKHETGDLKGSRQAVGANMLAGLTDFAPPTIVSQAARLQARQRFFNLIVTNVPGPQFPLYVLGRRMLEIYPMVPLAKRQAVCVGVLSYDGSVNFGLVGDHEAMAGLDDLAGHLAEELREMRRLNPPPPAGQAPPAGGSRRKRSATRGKMAVDKTAAATSEAAVDETM